MSSSLVDRLQQALHERSMLESARQLAPGPLVVGYSGGLDSSVLLHALAALPAARQRGLRALHVDHQLQPQSSAWAMHCAASCREFGVECVLMPVSVSADGRGLEAAARDARYQAFRSNLAANETLVLAHHRDDQVETILLRLLRGAGTAALAGMPCERTLDQPAATAEADHARLWRPLLDIARAELEHYARRHQLEWIEDPSNADSAQDRNFLRHSVLPLIRERWPQADLALAASARLLREDAGLIDQFAASALADAAGPDPCTLSLPRLRHLTDALLRHLLRRWLQELGLPKPPGNVLRRLRPELIDAARDGEPSLQWSGVVLRRYRDLLHVGQVKPPVAAWSCDWDGREPLSLPSGGTLELLPAHSSLPLMTVAPRAGGERIRLAGRPTRPLKTLLQELGVPPWQRLQLPLLFAEADGELLAAGDLAISARLASLLDERNLTLRWRRAGID